MFYYGYIITQLPGGYLAERFGSKLILGWMLLSSSILCAVSPLLARFDVRALIASRFLMGICQVNYKHWVLYRTFILQVVSIL